MIYYVNDKSYPSLDIYEFVRDSDFFLCVEAAGALDSENSEVNALSF